MVPASLLPDYQDRCLTNVLGAIVAPPRHLDAPLADLRSAIAGAAKVVMVVLDGLGDLQLVDRASLAPTIHAGRLEPITSVAPTTTAAALTSMTTGMAPGQHGIVGYRFAMGPSILQALRWSVEDRDAQRALPPERVQRSTPQLRHRGRGIPYVAKKQFATSGFTKAHLRGAEYVGVDDVNAMPAAVAAALDEAPVVLCYHDAIDKVAHAEGLGDAYEAAIARAEQLIVELRRQVSDDTAIVITSDHGQVDVGATTVELPRRVTSMVDRMSGEGRFRWLHVPVGDRADVIELLDEVRVTCWVMSRREVIASGMLGEVDDEVAERLGDVAVIPFVDAFVPDPAEPNEVRMKSRHGSLTPAEMYVPLSVC